MIERWFKELTDRRLRRGVFTNVTELIDVITTRPRHWNTDPQPFVWHTPAAHIIERSAAAAPPSATRPSQRQSTSNHGSPAITGR